MLFLGVVSRKIKMPTVKHTHAHTYTHASTYTHTNHLCADCGKCNTLTHIHTQI
jgi:hypothetical protein